MVFNGGGLLALGEQNSTDCQSTKVDFVNYNGGSQATPTTTEISQNTNQTHQIKS